MRGRWLTPNLQTFSRASGFLRGSETTMTNICDQLTIEDAAIRRRLPLARLRVLAAMQQKGDQADYSLMRVHARVRNGGWPIEARNVLRIKMGTLQVNTERRIA